MSYIINRHNPDCVFLSTYQNRSAKRNIDHLLQKWGLEGHLIDWEDFGFDMGKFIAEDGDDWEISTSTETDDSDGEPEGVHNADSDNYEQWLRLEKQEVSHDMAMVSGLPAGGPRPSLVDYSSNSESEDDAKCEMDTILEDDTQNVDSDASTSKVRAGHRMGDGGALSSVHLLWICKRGRGDSVVAWRKPGAGA